MRQAPLSSHLPEGQRGACVAMSGYVRVTCPSHFGRHGSEATQGHSGTSMEQANLNRSSIPAPRLVCPPAGVHRETPCLTQT